MCVPYTRINLDKWCILSILNKDWEDAELIYAISGEAALLLRNKELYFVGKWISDSANILSTLPTLPIKIKNLHFEDICFIASGIEHAVILSNKGFVSTFGVNNKCGQLGVGDESCLYNDELLVHNPILPAKIVDICCGNYFTLALDNSGKVWYWGLMVGNGKVRKKPICLSVTDIVKITASARLAATLNQFGEVYFWSSFPDKYFNLCSLVVQQIAYGDANLYILTNENELFSYGCGKLNPIEPICQFNYLTSNSNNKIAARSKNDGLFFVWEDPYRSEGLCRTKTKNILECFANTKMPGVCLPRKEESASVSEEDNTLTENIAKLYNSQNFSDVDITLSDGRIHAHKCILAARSELFCRVLTSINGNVINFSNVNSNVMKSYVTYIYTGSLPEIDNFDHLLELNDMAKDDSNKLPDYCITQGRSLTNEQNALAYYLASAKFKNTVLMEYCAKLIVKNLDQIAITEQFKNLSPKAVHELIGFGFKSDQCEKPA